jgi:Mannosyltransferase (PIG-V)
MTDIDLLPRADKTLPLWVRALDALCIALFLVAFVIHVGGGFRVRVGDVVRLSFLSWLPLIALGFVLLVARHWWQPRPSVLDRVAGAYRRLTSSVGWQEAWSIFVATRVTVLVVGLLAVYTIGFPERPDFRVSDNEAMNLPARWDAGWYLNIAYGGYRWNPNREERHQNIAFFPGYPLAIYVVGRFFGGSLIAHVTAAVVLSHAAFLWALGYLYRFSRSLGGDVHRARDAILLIASYPFAVFYGAIYTESLFLLGSVGAIYEFNARRWGRVAAWGLMVGVTRPNGFMLALTLAVLGLVQGIWTRRENSTHSRIAALAAVISPLLGVVLFSIYIGALTGNPLQWSAQHAAWGRTFTGTTPFVRSAEAAAEHGFEHYARSSPFELMNGVAAAFAIVATIPVGLRLGIPYAVFILSNIVPPLLVGGFISIGRVTATMFPIFVWLAIRQTPRTRACLVVAFAMLQALAAALFYTWRPFV